MLYPSIYKAGTNTSMLYPSIYKNDMADSRLLEESDKVPPVSKRCRSTAVRYASKTNATPHPHADLGCHGPAFRAGES